MGFAAQSTSQALDGALFLYQRTALKTLASSITCALSVTAVLVFWGAVVIPLATTTIYPGDVGRQAIEFLLTLLVGLVIGVPLLAAGLANLLTTGVRVALPLLGVGDVQVPPGADRRVFQLTLRALTNSIAPLGLGIVLLAGGGFLAGMLPADVVWPGLFVLLGGIFAVSGGLTFLLNTVRWSLAGVVLIQEGVDRKDALQRSSDLLRGNRVYSQGRASLANTLGGIGFMGLFAAGGMYGLLSLAGAFAAWSAIVSRWVIGPLLEMLLYLLPFAVVLVVVLPIALNAIAGAYVQQRIKIEGFDIESLHEEAERTLQRGTRK